jgi:hypothetical protein
MSEFRKKPVVVDAVQVPYSADDTQAWLDLSAHLGRRVGPEPPVIGTLEGAFYSSPGDWIIRGIRGEFYPCKPDIFEATYEPVDRRTEPRCPDGGGEDTCFAAPDGHRKCMGAEGHAGPHRDPFAPGGPYVWDGELAPLRYHGATPEPEFPPVVAQDDTKDEAESSVRRHLASGRSFLEAVRMYRNKTGLSLALSKAAVERIKTFSLAQEREPEVEDKKWDDAISFAFAAGYGSGYGDGKNRRRMDPDAAWDRLLRAPQGASEPTGTEP